MKSYILIYDGFANFEVVISSLLLNGKVEVITIGLDDKPVTSCEGFRYLPDKLIDNIVFESSDILIIPGGDPNNLYNREEVYHLIREGYRSDTLIAAICAGPIHLAKAGVLKDYNYTVSSEDRDNRYFNQENYIDKNVVVDGKIITAKPTGYVDMAIEIGRKLSLFRSEEELEGTIDFFKNFKS